MKWLSLICVAGLFCALPTAYSQEVSLYNYSDCLFRNVFQHVLLINYLL